MGAIVGLDHINLRIEMGPEALERARQFYGGLLGLTAIARPDSAVESPDPGAWYECGPNQVHITAEQGATANNRATRRHAAFLVKDLAGLRARLEAGGAEVRSGTQLPGRRRFFARDPFGNRLEFVEMEEQPR